MKFSIRLLGPLTRAAHFISKKTRKLKKNKLNKRKTFSPTNMSYTPTYCKIRSSRVRLCFRSTFVPDKSQFCIIICNKLNILVQPSTLLNFQISIRELSDT